ncbi:MAG: thioesterase family protein [Microthrixaceae bacterium]|nr:thioesterase family protein [Microthrixaceae bacterium]
MGDLDRDTALTGADGRYRATLEPNWEIWGPMGGYAAGLALRAAGVHCGRARPASMTCHFVGGVGSGPVEVDVETVRATRVATSCSVTLRQGDRTGYRALVWGVDQLDGLEHHTDRRPPASEPPQELPSVADLLTDGDADPPHPFWTNLDVRPLRWIADFDRRVPGEPISEAWYRFVPQESFDDPWVDAIRSLILIDLDSWSATLAAQPPGVPYYAPTIDLTAQFVGDARGEPWLRAWAEAPVAAHGLVAHRGEVWTPSGRLVATGGSTLLSRPDTRRPDRASEA